MRRAALLLAAASTLTLANQVTRAQAEPELSIFTPTPTVSSGQSFVIDVEISGVSDLYGWQLDLGFTPGVVTAGTPSAGPFLSKGGSTLFIAGTNDNVGGSVINNADTLISAVPGVTGSGILETLDFTAKKPGLSTFNLSNVMLVNSALNPIEASFSGTSVTVKGSVGVLEPPVAPLFALGVLACLASRLAPRFSSSLRST